MLQARNIHKRFGDLEVLKGIDICIPQGKVTAIVGPSGAGKSSMRQAACAWSSRRVKPGFTSSSSRRE